MGTATFCTIPFAPPTDNDMRPHFDIINSGTSAFPGKELTLHYRFTAAQTFNRDWTVRGRNNVTSQSDRIAMYRNGELIWGTEPRSATALDFVLAAVPTGVTVAQRGTATSALGITRTNGHDAATPWALLERTASCTDQ